MLYSSYKFESGEKWVSQKKRPRLPFFQTNCIFYAPKMQRDLEQDMIRNGINSCIYESVYISLTLFKLKLDRRFALLTSSSDSVLLLPFCCMQTSAQKFAVTFPPTKHLFFDKIHHNFGLCQKTYVPLRSILSICIKVRAFVV